MNNVFSYYPKKWSKIPIKSGRNLYAIKQERGYFAPGALNENRYEVKLENFVNGHLTIATDTVRTSTPFHEIGHLVEWFNPEVVRIGKEWIENRTKNEGYTNLKTLFPYAGFRNNEVVKKDDFITPYIGKYYEDGTEVLSIGLESLFLGNKHAKKMNPDRSIEVKGILDDIEYLNLIIGLILKG